MSEFQEFVTSFSDCITYTVVLAFKLLKSCRLGRMQGHVR